MRGDDEIGAIFVEVADRTDGEIEVDRLPVAAGVKRDVDAELCAREEEIALLGIFAYRAQEVVRRNAIDRERPCLAVVAGDVEIRFLIVETMAVDRRVCGSGIEAGSLNERDFAPGRKLRRVTSRQFLPPSVVR